MPEKKPARQRRRSKYDWESIDFNKTTGQISSETGAARSLVSKWRRTIAPHTVDATFHPRLAETRRTTRDAMYGAGGSDQFDPCDYLPQSQ